MSLSSRDFAESVAHVPVITASALIRIDPRPKGFAIPQR